MTVLACQIIPAAIVTISRIQTETFSTNLIGTIITFLPIILIYNFLPCHKVFNFLICKDFIIKLIIGNSFVICMIVSVSFHFMSSTLYENCLSIFGIILLIIFIDGELVISRFKQQKSAQKLKSYEDYLPIVDELITQVRHKQHDYDNDIQALRSLPLTYHDYDSLAQSIRSYSGDFYKDKLPLTLLKINMKLVAGFLFSKYKEAESEKKYMHLNIIDYDFATKVPEYILVEMFGILLDNAIENTKNKEDIYVIIKNSDDNTKTRLTVKNPGPLVTPEFCKNLFTEGYSTKTDTTNPHGIGLRKLKKLTNEYDGELSVENDVIDSVNYLCFELEV
ncbi:MAG: sensor histidine kinase [Eubacterium sp.]